MMTGRAPSRLRYRVVTVLAAAAIAAGVAERASPPASSASSSAKDRIAADPPPHLFDDTAIAPTGQQISGQQERARELMGAWWADHGTHEDDPAFTRWLATALPAPPPASQRATELSQVTALAGERTTGGVSAATWLEVHGKKDVWKLYGHDVAETQPTERAKATKKNLKAMLSMAKTVANGLDTHDRQPAPYVLDPALRTDHHVVAGQACPCSYPSSHAADGAAARTYLTALAPHRAQLYEWTEQEVDYSRLYMAGHLNSDITAGSLLGDMIGQYFLVTRAGDRADPRTVFFRPLQLMDGSRLLRHSSPEQRR